MHQGQSSQQKRKQIMKTVKTVQGGVIHTKPTPLPSNNRCSYNWLSTCQTCNYCSPPQRHLTPGQYITNKCCKNHNLQNNNTYEPNKFTWTCITCIVQSTKKVPINYYKEKRCSICMQVTQKPSIWHITHQMLYTVKSLINMCCIMHCLKNTSNNLQYQAKTCLSSPIIITILIRRSRISNQMILDHIQNRLVKNATTLFFYFSSH
jgi:hypothetical protein